MKTGDLTININPGNLDDMQAKAFVIDARVEYLYPKQGGRLRLTGSAGMPDEFWYALEMGGVAIGWVRFKLLDMIMGEKLFQAIALRPASEPAPDPSDMWSPFL